MWEVSSSCQEPSGNAQCAVVQLEKVVCAPLRRATKHRHNHGRRWQKCPPNAPHEALCLVPMHQIDGWRSPEQVDIMLGVLRGCMALKALLCSRRWCIAVSSKCVEGHTPHQPLTNYIRLLGGLSSIKQRRWRGAQGFMCGTRGQFLPALSVIGHGCGGCCWPVTSD